MTGGLAFILGDVLVGERILRILSLSLIMRQADIPHISVYILLLGPTVSPVKEMELAD